MKKHILFLCILLLYHLPQANARHLIKFGTLSVIDSTLLQSQLQPFVDYLAASLEEDVGISVGRNYRETMEKLSDGRLDIGFIGPAPYVTIQDRVELIATLLTKDSPYFNSVIVARKDSPMEGLQDLFGASFAFGSPNSTLSFYVPAYLLHQEGMLTKLAGYNFLYKHDRVAKNVIIGKYDAGGIKESVYLKYAEYLKVLHRSEPYYDFVIVVRKDFDPHLKARLLEALLTLDDRAILSGLKRGATGFIEGDESNYEKVRDIMREVDGLFLSR